MAKFFAVLLSTFNIFRWSAVVLALYGWLWLPSFQNGTVGGPYWMLSLYDRVVPILLGIGVVGFGLVWLYQALFGLVGAKPAVASHAFRGTFFWLMVIVAIGGLPSFLGQYRYLQQTDFADTHYHLIQRDNGTVANYFVFQCADPAGLWCHRVALSPNVPSPPPTPTPMPEPTAVIPSVGSLPLPTPTPFPTVTPPAKLITDTMGIELSIQIGNFRAPITHTQPITTATTGE